MNTETVKPLSSIALKNDEYRRAPVPCAWARFIITRSIIDDPDMADIVGAMRSFNTFSEDNDPHEEHDWGRFEVNGEWFNFKFDYFEDSECNFGADDLNNCYRVLTLMRASEY